MSSLKAFAKDPRPAGALTRSLCALGFSLAVSALSIQAQAACLYTVTGQWTNGFSATIKVTNDGTTATNGWNLGWQYAGDNRVTGGWDVALTGTNPYTAKNAGWNGTIQPNQSVTFGFQGTKGAAAAEIPALTGPLCGATNSSSAPASSSSLSSSSRSSSSSSVLPSSSSIPSSSVRSSSSSSVLSSSSSSVPVTGGWTLNTTDSYLNFATTKNTSNLEVHNFTTISGDINASGVATLAIDLNSVNTGVALRDQRMRDLLFETATNPTATVTVTVPANLIANLAVGQTSQTDITASLNLHGVTANITTKVSVQKLTASRVVVQSLPPVLVKAETYGLTAGVEALRVAVNIASINASVPVDFALVYDAR
ncbi:MAG: carbohydrate-binding protein [Cellvibrio sp. 79]|nr:MAG: carbohydrate-binding protein [Cellvibrio sp. 79]